VARLKHWLEYAGFRTALAGNRLLGDRAAARVGEALGRLGYPLAIRRDVVERNLRIAFPDRDADWISRVARASYAHLGRELLVMLRLSFMTRADVMARTIVHPESQAVRDYQHGRGLVVVAGHLGNWELGGAAYAVRGFAIDAIAKRAANPLFYRHILDARARLGFRVIDAHGAAPHALRALRAGHVVAIVADQYAGRGGVPVPFFGRTTSMFRAPAVLALRSGSPLHLCLPPRLTDGRYDVTLEPIETTPTDDMEADVARITAAWAARLEAAIREYPEQYLWHHRRWRDPIGAGPAAPRPHHEPPRAVPPTVEEQECPREV
jgi:Kdo2-lipid IVA lauroyltransferase/acyltransferase